MKGDEPPFQPHKEAHTSGPHPAKALLEELCAESGNSLSDKVSRWRRSYLKQSDLTAAERIVAHYLAVRAITNLEDVLNARVIRDEIVVDLRKDESIPHEVKSKYASYIRAFFSDVLGVSGPLVSSTPPLFQPAASPVTKGARRCFGMAELEALCATSGKEFQEKLSLWREYHKKGTDLRTAAGIILRALDEYKITNLADLENTSELCAEIIEAIMADPEKKISTKAGYVRTIGSFFEIVLGIKSPGHPLLGDKQRVIADGPPAGGPLLR